jgi:hypothetical protein
MTPWLLETGPEYGSSDTVSKHLWKNRHGVQKFFIPYPSMRWVLSTLWWSQSNKKWGEVDGLRKKCNPRFHARTKLHKEEDMIAGRQRA